ncbi:MAG: hypothetical protein C4342_03905 [Armatimonadota bacterium]
MFHVKSYGETAFDPGSFHQGLLLGILIGEGHFGGDGRQPQVTLRMHSRHHELFAWLTQQVPGSRLYGPYDHGGRSYYQWIVRGAALREYLVPLLDRLPWAHVDPPSYRRYREMKLRYGLEVGA